MEAEIGVTYPEIKENQGFQETIKLERNKEGFFSGDFRDRVCPF
jgi:hypothetical protein